jgi:hypothetical protein
MISRDGATTIITPPKLSASPPSHGAGENTSGAMSPDMVDETLPTGMAPVAPAATHNVFLPLLLALLTLLVWMGFQGWLTLQDRKALTSAQASQQPTVDNAAKLRASLDALAADTQRLADAGNASARLLVEELRKRGVTINPGK